ncbi:uncharacterized protein EV154DRAFT_604364 [Mucor mucedo]|uniref:uncharacterized protein n=1 Tax=Mucor mucedo TaxID=29922 RepID=UPI00221E6B1E|nr:uncharacterized protein EV154DRAFT_604364 [Mucor mucedo]KAI7889013.1 hypothetical protein EV154DRAFT_604364 [Mucor mucedo]
MSNRYKATTETSQPILIHIRRPKSILPTSKDIHHNCSLSTDSQESSASSENHKRLTGPPANTATAIETSSLICKPATKRAFAASTIPPQHDENNTLPAIQLTSATTHGVSSPEDLSSHSLDKDGSSMRNNFQFGDMSNDFLSQSSLPEVPHNPSLRDNDTPKWALKLQAQMNRLVALFEVSTKENLTLRQELKLSNARITALQQKLSGTRRAGNFDYNVPETFLNSFGSNASKYSDTNNSAKQSTTGHNSTKASSDNKKEHPKTSFADMAKKPVPLNNNRKRTTSKQRKAAARIFEAPAEQISSDTFLYLYLPNKYRIRIKDFRQKLPTMGLDNGCIFDIHYPARGVVALLIHQSYRVELDSILTKSNIAPVKDFNPTSIEHLHDPSLNHLTVDERSTKAIEFLQNRLIRGLKFIRSYLRRSVARNFLQLGWITNEQAQQVISETNNENGHSNTPTNTFETTRAPSTSQSHSGSSGLGEVQEYVQATNINNEQMDIEDETYDNSLPGAGQPAPRQ